MSAIETDRTAFAVLTDKEREILRLLSAGHTVKTIAAQLGRSEASINERLREARRKTKVGSSRELARLLAAQKIRDDFSGLTPALGAGQPSVQRPHPRRVAPKGTTMLLLALPVAAAGLALASIQQPAGAGSSPAATAAAAASPLEGTWALDLASIPAAERPRGVTIAFHRRPGGKWAVHVEIAAADGTAQVADSLAVPDGAPVPVSGTMPFVDSASLRQPGPNTLVMTLGKGGKPVSTRVYTVSKDRRVLTETIVWASDALPGLETTRFTRVG